MAKIEAQLVIEILGRPAEHVSEALKGLIDRLSSEKGVRVKESKFHDPKKIDEKQEIYTSFVETTIDVEDISTLINISFSYMPSHIEIIYPESLTVTNSDLTSLTNTIIQKIHNYDSITKKVLMDKEIILNKLREVAPHLFENNQKKPAVNNEIKESKSEIKTKSKSKKSKKKN